jgi:hypothetical protein
MPRSQLFVVLVCPVLSGRSSLSPHRIAPHHRDFDFAGIAEGGAWDFRSVELEDGVEWKRRTVFALMMRNGAVCRMDMSLENQSHCSRALNGRARLCGAVNSPRLDGVSPYHFITRVEQ